jgi:hypothetical protein
VALGDDRHWNCARMSVRVRSIAESMSIGSAGLCNCLDVSWVHVWACGRVYSCFVPVDVHRQAIVVVHGAGGCSEQRQGAVAFGPTGFMVHCETHREVRRNRLCKALLVRARVRRCVTRLRDLIDVRELSMFRANIRRMVRVCEGSGCGQGWEAGEVEVGVAVLCWRTFRDSGTGDQLSTRAPRAAGNTSGSMTRHGCPCWDHR